MQHIPEWPIMLMVIGTLCATWFLIGFIFGCKREKARYDMVKGMAEEIAAALRGIGNNQK